ncbi:hypothetical protein MAR_029206 [Mya arenaria]|uniref:Uncharacterized protein n=1 Tax=Mya arenaria TaxID=6604 RepID=A0ABY7DIS9_MYAAR|nr:hypothetical protein MAR_029206 [Mya arenaria]
MIPPISLDNVVNWLEFDQLDHVYKSDMMLSEGPVENLIDIVCCDETSASLKQMDQQNLML